jgi:hypothetical protein
MTVRDDGDVIRLEGACRVEEAEALTALLQAGLRPVDLALCREAHSAVLQVLLAFRPPILREPGAEPLRALLRSATARSIAPISAHDADVAQQKLDKSASGDVKTTRRAE